MVSLMCAHRTIFLFSIEYIYHLYKQIIVLVNVRLKIHYESLYKKIGLMVCCVWGVVPEKPMGLYRINTMKGVWVKSLLQIDHINKY